MPPRRFPDPINDDAELMEHTFVVPNAAFGDEADTVPATPTVGA